MRELLFIVLLAIVFANQCQQNNRLVAQSGQKNTFYFTAGASTSNGQPSIANMANQNYQYSFSGLPSWLSAQGSSLVGLPPTSGNQGPWPISVNYGCSQTGGLNGSSNFLLSLNQSSGGISQSGLSSVYYYPSTSLSGSSLVSGQSGCWVLLIPIITTIAIPVVTPTIVTTNTVSCTTQQNNYNGAQQTVVSIQNEISGYNSQLANAQ
jgi:hypothetical protein